METSWQEKQAEAEALRTRLAKMSRLNRWVAVAAAVAVVGALAVPGYRLFNASSLRSECFAQERSVESEAQAFRASNQDFPNSVSELPSGKDLSCPAGGDYVWDPVSGELTCSEHGHVK